MLPSRCPWRCCRCSPLQLRCHCATLRHFLTHCPPSTCRLVVTSSWLSLRHLSSRHRLSRRRLVVHVTSRCKTLLFAPAGCCVTSPPPPPLNVPACCHLASHHPTLLFVPPGCPITPRRATTSIKFGFNPPILRLPIIYLRLLHIFIPLHQNAGQQSVVGVERRRNEGRGGVSSTKCIRF